MPDNAITMACGVATNSHRLLIVTTTDDGLVCFWLIEKPHLPSNYFVFLLELTIKIQNYYGRKNILNLSWPWTFMPFLVMVT